MPSSLPELDDEPLSRTARRVAAIAAPVALGELGWMSMTVVDTVMVGTLGPAAIGAIGIGNSAFYTISIFSMGLLFGLDTLVSQSFGARDRADCRHSLMQATYLALLISIPVTAVMLLMPAAFRALRIVPQVSGMAGKFVVTLGFGTLPLLVYGTCRRYLQALGRVRPIMFALLSANIVNWLFNWLLIRGHAGFPALGVVGSALSTCLARVYMAAMLAFAIWNVERGIDGGARRIFRRPDVRRMRTLLRIGLPAATQIAFEIGAFGAVGILAGRLSAGALAAHQIALNCAAVSFMVPLGISSAAAVTVGQAIGRGHLHLARRSGFVSVALACLFMACAAVVFLAVPRQILGIYTSDASVIATGTSLLGLAAGFQLFDGVQTVATGALRAAGKTRVPMLTNLCGYWLFGLPIGYALCFNYRRGVFGLWWGLTIALAVISIILLYEWSRASKHLERFAHPALQPTPEAAGLGVFYDNPPNAEGGIDQSAIRP